MLGPWRGPLPLGSGVQVSACEAAPVRVVLGCEATYLVPAHFPSEFLISFWSCEQPALLVNRGQLGFSVSIETFMSTVSSLVNLACRTEMVIDEM